LYVILARRAPVAVVFRRGPSRQVLLIRWNTEDDTFEMGQWFKGRIYERRCDLDPDGDLLIYFAANWQHPYLSWTAVSRPPYLTALALWPKGDGWGGGGHFLSRKRIALNHRRLETGMTEASTKPAWLQIEPFGDCPGWGEDNPIWFQRLERDGWKVVNQGKVVKQDYDAKVWIEYDPAITLRRRHPKWPERYALEMSITAMNERDGPWYVMEHNLIRPDGVEKMGRSDWADWSHNGDLLYAKDGRLFRLRRQSGKFGPVSSSEEIADFSKLEFEARESPPEARVWPVRLLKGSRRSVD
jgi:hypothetical protein